VLPQCIRNFKENSFETRTIKRLIDIKKEPNQKTVDALYEVRILPQEFDIENKL